MSQPAYIAVDLGAESGRVMVGTLNEGRLTLHEVHRFRHLPVPTPSGLCWDVTGLWRQILDGLRHAAGHLAGSGATAVSIGVDTWGIDWTLISAEGVMLGLPRCYRDPVFEQAFKDVTGKLPRRDIYNATGIQLMPLNTLYQYHSRYAQDKGVFEAADSILFMPDLFHWLLSGVARVERTIASTSQMVDVRHGGWNIDLLQDLGLPTGPLPPPTDPGTPIGTLRDEVVKATGLPASVQIVLPPSHDTASAIAAVPAEPETKWCYLSSGTWSLLGAELDRPCITDVASKANFTNELGVSGTVRFHKNISGLFLVQEVRRSLERHGQILDYTALTEQAEKVEPMRTLIPVSDPTFALLGGAIQHIRDYAHHTGQPVPDSPGQMVRCCLDSLTLEYRLTLHTLEQVLDKQFEVLHVVGGGGKNRLLNHMIAQATGKTVVVGPAEATALGNTLTQALGLGHVYDHTQIREIVRCSTELQVIDDRDQNKWIDNTDRYTRLPLIEMT